MKQREYRDFVRNNTSCIFILYISLLKFLQVKLSESEVQRQKNGLEREREREKETGDCNYNLCSFFITGSG